MRERFVHVWVFLGSINTLILFSLWHSASCQYSFYSPVCQQGTFGKKCRARCNCHPGIRCHPVSGKCICPKGRTGDKCDEGTFTTFRIMKFSVDHLSLQINLNTICFNKTVIELCFSLGFADILQFVQKARMAASALSGVAVLQMHTVTQWKELASAQRGGLGSTARKVS